MFKIYSKNWHSEALENLKSDLIVSNDEIKINQF